MTVDVGGGDLRRRSVVGALWAAAQNWYSKLAALLTTLVLARLLTPEDFGLVALAMAFVSIATVVTEGGFAPAIVQAKELSKVTAHTAFWVSVLLALLLVGVVQILAAPAAALFDEPGIEPILRVLSVLLPLTALSSVQMALLTRQLQMRALAVRQFVSVAAGVIVGVGGALLGWGAWALVGQTLAVGTVGLVVLWFASAWRPRLLFSMAEAGRLVRTGGAVLGTNLVHQVRDRGDEFLIGGILGAEALGLWSVGTRLAKIAIDLFYSVVSAITFPVLARVHGDPERFGRGVQMGMTLNLFLVLPALVGLAVATPVVVPLLFGPQWTEAIPAAQIFTVAVAIGVLQWLDSRIWWAQGRFRLELLLALVISALHLVAVAVAAPFGLVAVAVAVLARTLLTTPLRFAALMRWSGLSLRIYRNVPGTVASVAVMAGCVWGVLQLMAAAPLWASAAAAVATGAVVYLGVSLLLQRRALRIAADLLRRRRGAG